MKRGLSIRIKILALVAAIVLIPTSLLTYLSQKTASEAIKDEIMKSIHENTNNIKGTVNMFLKTHEENLRSFSQNKSLISFLSSQRRDIGEMLGDLEWFKSLNSDIQSIYVATADKELYIVPEADLPDDFDPTTRVWYTNAVSKNDLIWTDPYLDAAVGNLVITVAIPVYDENNDILGVLGADISLEYMTGIINSFRIGDTGYYILSTNRGKIVTHPQQDKIGQPLATDVLREEAISGEYEGKMVYHYNGEDKYTAYTTIDKTDWKLFGTFNLSEIRKKTNAIVQSSIIATVLLITAGILMGVFLSNPIIRNIKRLVKDMNLIGNGDFTVRSKIRSKDEIGLLVQSLNKMTADLSSTMENIKKMSLDVSMSADSLAASAEESSATTEEISRTITEIVKVTEDQAYSTEDGLKKTTQLAENIQDVSSEIDKIIDVVKESNTLKEKGLNAVIVLKEKSDASNAASDEINSAILEMDKSAEQIGVIVETINNIAAQTNLLSLNASIEAARAGESGRGFAVVADEIRKLAEQSAEASRSIKSLIDNIQAKSKNAVNTVDESKKIIEAQNVAVAETQGAFNDISEMLQSISDNLLSISSLNEVMVGKKNEILSVMEAISASAEETSASTEQISASSVQQAAAIEEVAKTAEHLNILAQKLSEEISKFKIDEK